MNSLPASLLCLAILGGCPGIKNTIVKPVVTEVPNSFTTNVTVTLFSDGRWHTNYAIAPTTTTNWVRNAETFEVVNTVGSLVPGYGTLVAGLLGLMATGYASYLNRRNRTALVSTIEGVEQFRDQLKAAGETGKKLDDVLVNGLKYAHVAAGVGALIQKAVDDNTAPSPSPASQDVNKALAGKPA